MNAVNIRTRRHITMAMALCSLGFGVPVVAQAAVTVACTVSVTGVAFGTYNPLAATQTTSTGTLRIACTGAGTGTTTVTPTVTFSTGFSGTYTTRKMFSGVNALNYNLYWSTAYTQVMGDGTGGSFGGSTTAPLTIIPGQTSVANGTMYGMMPALQDVAPGLYADTVIVTVSY